MRGYRGGAQSLADAVRLPQGLPRTARAPAPAMQRGELCWHRSHFLRGIQGEEWSGLCVPRPC